MAQAGSKRRRKIPQEHYDTVQLMLMNVVPQPQIITQCAGRWGKPPKYVMDVIVRVHEDWATQAAMTADHRRHQIRHGFETLFLKASKANQNQGDLNLQARILRELGLLDGCYKPQGVDVNVSGGIGVGVGISLGALGFKNQEEVAARIDELRKKLAAQGPAMLAPPTTVSAQDHVNAITGGNVPTAATAGFQDADEDDSDN